MTDYFKDGYTQPGYKAKSLNSDFDGLGKKVSYPSRSWNFDLNKRWILGAHTVLFGGSYTEDKFSETMEIRFITGSPGTEHLMELISGWAEKIRVMPCICRINGPFLRN